MTITIHGAQLVYHGTKTEIAALSGLPADTKGFADDTDESGWFDGTNWHWIGEGGGSGDMTKAVYDIDNDGVVDAAETVPWAGISGAPSTFPPDAHDILSTSHGDSTAAAGVRGDVIMSQGVTPKWARLAISIPGTTALLNVLGVRSTDLEPVWFALFTGSNPTTIAPGDTASSGSVQNAARRDHRHPAPATWPPTAHNLLSTGHGDTTADAVVRGDLIVGIGASPKWVRYAISVPGANLLNILAVANGDVEPVYKALFDVTAPGTIGISDVAASGTSIIAARRDHTHGSPAAWTPTLHAITDATKHSSTATAGQMLKADANGLPINATNTDAQVSAAVTASHAAVTIADTATVDLVLATQALSANVIPGGIKLDDLGTPDNNTDLNATTTYHGLLPILPNDAAKFLDGTGAWDFVNWADLAGVPISQLWFADLASGIGGYATLQQTPVTGVENDDSVTINNASGETLIEGYISAVIGTTALNAGAWVFDIWRYVSSATGISRLIIRVVKRTSGGVETELFNVTTGEINDTSVTYQEIITTQGDFIVAATDRLVIKVNAITDTVPNKTIHFVHDGTTHNSHVHLPGISTGTPATHHTTHEAGGVDAIKLDDLAAPDDNTDLNASATLHGLLPKLDGTVVTALNADKVDGYDANVIVKSDGWLWPYSYTMSYSAANQVKINDGGAALADFTTGMKLTYTQATGGVKFAVITGVTLASGDTALNIQGGDSYALVNQAITAPSVSRIEYPAHWPCWFAFTPVWSSSGTAPVLNNGSITGKFRTVGRSCLFRWTLTPGSTTTFGTGNYTISLPIACVNPGEFLGSWYGRDTGVANYFRIPYITGATSTTAITLFIDPTNANNVSTWTPTSPWTQGSADASRGQIEYEF